MRATTAVAAAAIFARSRQPVSVDSFALSTWSFAALPTASAALLTAFTAARMVPIGVFLVASLLRRREYDALLTKRKSGWVSGHRGAAAGGLQLSDRNRGGRPEPRQ